jgi:hypothetical protein
MCRYCPEYPTTEVGELKEQLAAERAARRQSESH